MIRATIATLSIAAVLTAGCPQQPEQSAAAEPEPVRIAQVDGDTQLAQANPENALPEPTPPLDQIVLPDGFGIHYYASDVPGARSMTLSPGGILYVGTRDEGNVYAVLDRDGDHRAEQVVTIASGLRMPNGVAWRDGSLYVAEVSRILRYDDIDNRLDNPPEPVVIRDDYPTDRAHGWKFIAFGPDGKLYVPVGAPCNICEPPGEIYASITRINADGSNREIIARGIRNTVGFDWHPGTGELWFTDNGRDGMGDNIPPDELNRLSEEGLHFGYPYCHGRDVLDPQFGGGRSCDEFTLPEAALGPHVAALGMRFYRGDAFPERYRGGVFIAEHGSWNRTSKIGYRVMSVPIQGSSAVDYEVFAQGWLQGEQNWGRPVDVQELPDGSLLVSDDYAGAIYRIVYAGE